MQYLSAPFAGFAAHVKFQCRARQHVVQTLNGSGNFMTPLESVIEKRYSRTRLLHEASDHEGAQRQVSQNALVDQLSSS